jgi:hypothetical protein
MQIRNISAVIDRIVCKKIYFSYKDNIYYYLYPNSELRLRSSLLYEEHYDKLKYDNLIEEDIDYYLQDYDIADASLRKFLDNKYKQLDNLKVDLYENFWKTKESQTIRNKVKTVRKTIQDTENQLHYLDSLTTEYLCSQRQNEFLFLNGIYDTNNDLVFDYSRPDEIDEYTFNNMIRSISNKLLKNAEYRIIARSAEWKSIWNIKNHNIFSDPIIEWSEEQKTLVAFSQMYDNIHSHPECPDSKIIEDDDALDGWSIYQNKKLEQEKKKNGVSNILDKHKNAQEIFLVAQDDKEFEKIMEMNDSKSLNTLKNRFDFINKHGAVTEDRLPDVREDIRQQYAQMNKRK